LFRLYTYRFAEREQLRHKSLTFLDMISRIRGVKTKQLSGPVVVTGGAGFLGHSVVRQLLDSGVKDVRVVDLLPWDGRDPRVRGFVKDLRKDDLAEAFDGARAVLHLAACQYHTPLARSTYDLPFFEVNVEGTRRTLEAAKRGGAGAFSFVSTNMVYGLPRELPITEAHPTNPFGPYGRSKLEAEALVVGARGGKMKTAIVRPGLIVGPGRTGVIARVFESLLRNKPVLVIGSGQNLYEMMSCEDVASLTIAAAAQGRELAFNCAARSVPRMREWIQVVAGQAGSRSRIVGTPGFAVKWVCRLLETVRLSPLRKDQYLIADRDYYMSASLAERELGWTPRWGGLEAILETFRWYKGVREGDPSLMKAAA